MLNKIFFYFKVQLIQKGGVGLPVKVYENLDEMSKLFLCYPD